MRPCDMDVPNMQAPGRALECQDETSRLLELLHSCRCRIVLLNPAWLCAPGCVPEQHEASTQMSLCLASCQNSRKRVEMDHSFRGSYDFKSFSSQSLCHYVLSAQG